MYPSCTGTEKQRSIKVIYVLGTAQCIVLYHKMWLHVSTNYMESQANRTHENKITVVNFILHQNEISVALEGDRIKVRNM